MHCWHWDPRTKHADHWEVVLMYIWAPACTSWCEQDWEEALCPEQRIPLEKLTESPFQRKGYLVAVLASDWYWSTDTESTDRVNRELWWAVIFGWCVHCSEIACQEEAGHVWGHMSDSLYFLLQVDGGGSRLMVNHIGPHFQKHPRPAMNWSLIAARVL